MSDQKSNSATSSATSIGLSRRGLLAGASAMAGVAFAAAAPSRAAVTAADFRGLPPYGNGTLPTGVRSRLVANVNGLTVNMLEAGFEMPGRPLVLLLHGFPNLAYSWRKVMPALAGAAIMRSRRTVGASAARPAGTMPSTPTRNRFSRSTWCATRSRS